MRNRCRSKIPKRNKDRTEERKGEGVQAGDLGETGLNPLDDKTTIQRKKGTGNSVEGPSLNITLSLFERNR